MRREGRRLRFERLRHLVGRAHTEAVRCEKARAYFAGWVMLGVALEAALVAMTRVYPHHPYKFHKTIARWWSLDDLIKVSERAGWLQPDGVRAAKRIQQWRNFLHADKFAQRRSLSVRHRTLDARLKDFELITGQLYDFIVGPGGLAQAIKRMAP